MDIDLRLYRFIDILSDELEMAPVRPGYARLTLASEGSESKMPFPQRNKKLVAARTQNSGSFVPLQFPPSPMMVFAIRVELTHDVPVQCAHDADPGQHRRAALQGPSAIAGKETAPASTLRLPLIGPLHAPGPHPRLLGPFHLEILLKQKSFPRGNVFKPRGSQHV
jgi:hypothetical protein